ncbi:sigma A [Pycnonotidae orthoreovirus]|uniref:Sigma A n=1 Tax=Pycnonotidae orthoreovirus TaxID=3070176 RepID=A0A0B6VNZ1_9REOV|nr:sigma A [Avian orthoreovirus]BAQ19502.1 sigma A [Avian orthoreovirus]
MARAVYDFFTAQFGNNGLPITASALSSILSASNSPWQLQQSPSYSSMSPGLISTEAHPFPGSKWFQESMLFSAFVPPVLAGRDAWRDANFRRLCWTDEGLSGLVTTPDPPRAPEYQPVSGQWFDLLQYPRWANRQRELEVKYPLLLKSSLLNMMTHGPILYVETWPRMCTGVESQFMMSILGNDFKEACYRMIQSASNMPITPDGQYDVQMRTLISVWLLSYVGVVHQNATIGGFYFTSKARGNLPEGWFLSYSTNGARLNITQRHFGYFDARSPDWNADQNWLAAAHLSSIVMSCRQFPLISNQAVVNGAHNRPNYTAANGTVVRELQLLACATECIRKWMLAGLVPAAKGREMIQEANDYNNRIRAELDAIKAADDALYNQQVPYARRLKPYSNRSWTIGQTMQSLNALATFVA